MGVNRLNSVQKATNLKKKSKVGMNEMFTPAVSTGTVGSLISFRE